MCQPYIIKYLMLEIVTKNPITRCKLKNLKKIETYFDYKIGLPNSWHKIYIPTHRGNIEDIKIQGESIGYILNSGVQTDEHYAIWLHGNIAKLIERVLQCMNQSDLLKWTKLNRKYLHTESYNQVTPDFVPESVKAFFKNGDGPYWWLYDKDTDLPYKHTNIQIDKTKILESLEDLTFEDKKFYGSAMCKSLQKFPDLPLTPVTQLTNEYLKNWLLDIGYRSILQIQYVEMSGKSYIKPHRDDFSDRSGLMYMQGAKQLYCVIKGDPDKFNLRFAKAGMIDVNKPVLINNNSFVHSLYYDGEDTRSTLLIYGN